MTDAKPEPTSYTIREFCERYHMGRTHYYALQKTGEGPVELRAGLRKVLITRRSAEAWEQRFEKQAANNDADSAQNAA
jgi:hypothetical protein